MKKEKCTIEAELWKPSLADLIILNSKLRENPELGNISEEEYNELINGTTKLSEGV